MFKVNNKDIVYNKVIKVNNIKVNNKVILLLTLSR